MIIVSKIQDMEAFEHLQKEVEELMIKKDSLEPDIDYLAEVRYLNKLINKKQCQQEEMVKMVFE